MDSTSSPSYWRAAALGFGCMLSVLVVFVGFQVANSWQLELDTLSEYSHIRIRRHNDVRTLLFVRDDGSEVVESRMDMEAPHRLLLSYSQVMFASYFFRPHPQDVLVVGLGGGSMVRFLQHHEPELNIDVLEIDPVIVRLAASHFGTRETSRVRILTVDAFNFLRDTEKRYDVIYMDAFLKPSEETDATGVPQRLKTIEFYRVIQEKLTPEGIVAFNLNSHAETEFDITTIRRAFRDTYVFHCGGSSNLVAIGLTSHVAPSEVGRRAAQLDDRFDVDFSFQEIWKARRQDSDHVESM